MVQTLSVYDGRIKQGMSDSNLHEVTEIPMMLFGPIRRVLASAQIAAICVVTASTPALSQTKVDDCTPATFNVYVQQISAFRQIEFLIGELVHVQSQMILQFDTGVEIRNDDGGYFGPSARLQYVTGRTQQEIKSSVNAGKRLKLDDQAMARLLEMSENADEIVAVGFEMIKVLEADEIIEATRMLNERSLPAYRDSMGASHTVIAEVKSRSSKEALKCR